MTRTTHFTHARVAALGAFAISAGRVTPLRSAH
ncbi:hypothetical protein EDD25_1296 [Cryobacterium psychrophilum]|nr:hypothetical protein EDD25_1296 [Cryobacterium psychrophilum]